jgi:hypothetical protein
VTCVVCYAGTVLVNGVAWQSSQRLQATSEMPIEIHTAQAGIHITVRLPIARPPSDVVLLQEGDAVRICMQGFKDAVICAGSGFDYDKSRARGSLKRGIVLVTIPSIQYA